MFTVTIDKDGELLARMRLETDPSPVVFYALLHEEELMERAKRELGVVQPPDTLAEVKP